MSWADDMWWKVPLSECPICKKKFARAPEHYWMIGEHSFEKRDVAVCSYTCMRKWEKEMEAKEKAKRRLERRRKYPEWALLAVMEKLEKDSDKELVALYFGKGERSDKIVDKLNTTVYYRVAKIRKLLNKIMEEE